MPEPEHHRERILKHGASSLSEAELLANLLRTGNQRRSALEMARDLLVKVGGLRELLTTNGRLLRLQGVGPAKASTILACLEIGRRLARSQLEDRLLLDQPATVAGYVAMKYLNPDQEITGCLYLDVRGRLIADKELFRGTQARTAIEPRAILKEALLYSASGFILFHTHPSGDPAPSIQDVRFTRRIAKAGETMGIRLVDHVIVASGGNWTSMRRRGAW